MNILQDIKEMVQVEISICSPDESVIRKYEKETPSFKTTIRNHRKIIQDGHFCSCNGDAISGNQGRSNQTKE